MVCQRMAMMCQRMPILDVLGESQDSARFGYEKSAILGPSGYSNEQLYISLKFWNHVILLIFL